jgi:hypothetical protein
MNCQQQNLRRKRSVKTLDVSVCVYNLIIGLRFEKQITAAAMQLEKGSKSRNDTMDGAR